MTTSCDYCRANGARVCVHMPGQTCSTWYPATVKLGRVLSQQAIVEAA